MPEWQATLCLPLQRCTLPLPLAKAGFFLGRIASRVASLTVNHFALIGIKLANFDSRLQFAR